VPVVGEKQEAIRRRDWCAPVTNWSNSATTPPSPFGRRYQRPRPTEWIRGARNLVGERKGRKERGGLRRVRHGPVAMPVATFVCRHLRSYRRQPDRSICALTASETMREIDGARAVPLMCGWLLVRRSGGEPGREVSTFRAVHPGLPARVAGLLSVW
jgi:hypothetical protein